MAHAVLSQAISSLPKHLAKTAQGRKRTELAWLEPQESVATEKRQG
jgi:hypothetical protein